MQWIRPVWVWLAFCCLLEMATAQVVLQSRLQQLPVSVGENVTISRKVGESWVDIGVRMRVGYEQLRRANGRNFTRARKIFIPGRHQVSAMMATGLVINLPELMNYCWQDGKPVAWYPVSVGRVAERWHTPVGQLHVKNRKKNPAWHRPEWAGGGVQPAGVSNPLGDRWIGLNRTGYGLHGTNDPSSIGRMVSHGCIRHFPQHIRQLFNAVRVGMPVVLTYETVTVGQENGVVYLAIFPDIYARGTNAPEAVRTRLATYGLADVLSADELGQWLAQADGVARPILGSAKGISINGVHFDAPIGLTVKQGVSYLPLPTLAEALQAEISWDQTTQTATLSRGEQQVTFTPADNTFTALDTLFVPVRRVVENLGGTVDYSTPELAVQIAPFNNVLDK